MKLLNPLKRGTSVVTLALLGVACGGSDEASGGGATPAPAIPPGSAVTCGAGTLLGDANQCVPAPMAPSLKTVAITHLDSHYDESKPLYVDHKLPLRIGVTSTADKPLLDPAGVQVTIGLIESLPATATQAQVDAAASCFVRSAELKLDGSGKEQMFELDRLVIPKECLPAGRASVDYNLTIQVDYDERALPADHARLFYFTEMEKPSPAISQCSSKTGEDAHDGCIHHFHVIADPGFDIEETIHPESKVAIFWQKPVGVEVESHPMLSLQVDMRAYGHDPFDLKGPDSDKLPGTVSERVRIAPAVGPHAGEYQPVLMQAADPKAAPTQERAFDRLQPASRNETEFELFPNDATRELVMTGDWKDVDQFTVEACLHAEGFERHHELGNIGEEPQENADPKHDDCHRFTILGVRALPPTNAASRIDVGETFSRVYGNEAAALNIDAKVQGNATVGAAIAQADGSVRITSQYLPDLTIARAHAYAGFDLFSPDSTALVAQFDLLGTRQYSYERRVPESKGLLNYEKSWAEERCKSGRFQVGPVPISIEGCVRGEAGFKFDLGLFRDEKVEPRRFPSADTEGQLKATVTPYFKAGGTARAAADAGIFRAGVEGNLTVIDVSFPLVASANVGLTRADATNGGRPSAQANLNANWKLELKPLSGSIVAFFDAKEVQWCSKKVGWVKVTYPCGLSWDRKGSFTLFSFGSSPISYTLLDRTFGNVSLKP